MPTIPPHPASTASTVEHDRRHILKAGGIRGKRQDMAEALAFAADGKIRITSSCSRCRRSTRFRAGCNAAMWPRASSLISRET